MRVLYVVDAQSPHSANWIRMMVDQGIEAHLITTYPIEQGALPVASTQFVPWDFSAKARKNEKGSGFGSVGARKSPLSRLRGGKAWRTLVELRARLAPRAVAKQAGTIRAAVERVRPDLVHAMRLPYEGYMAARALADSPVPFLVSTWGIDFTLYAVKSAQLRRFTEEAMRRTDGLHPDCAKDLRLAASFGFDSGKASAVLPGNGGIDANVFHQGDRDRELLERLGIPPDAQIVVNSRGIKPYVRSDTFFAAVPKILENLPNVWFVCVAMEGKPVAESFIARYGGAGRVVLTGALRHDEMGALFRSCDVSVSLSEHDGTPNSVLESMACGCFPVVGDIESLREWVEQEKNGLLVDPGDPDQAARAVIRALRDQPLRSSAAGRNATIAESLNRENVAAQALALYRAVAAVRS